MTAKMPVCPHCGSHQIKNEGALKWDNATQSWVSANAEYDVFTCRECGDECDRPKWIAAPVDAGLEAKVKQGPWQLAPTQATRRMMDAMKAAQEDGFWAMYEAALAVAPRQRIGA